MWETQSGQYMWVRNRKWAIYVCGQYRVDNICVWEIERGQYMCVGNREWTIYVGGK